MTEKENFTYNTIEEYLQHLPEVLKVTCRKFMKNQILMGDDWYKQYLDSSDYDDYAYLAITTNSARYKMKDEEGYWKDYIRYPFSNEEVWTSKPAPILKAVDDLYKFIKENHPDQLKK